MEPGNSFVEALKNCSLEQEPPALVSCQRGGQLHIRSNEEGAQEEICRLSTKLAPAKVERKSKKEMRKDKS
jgi:hypothetical protein